MSKILFTLIGFLAVSIAASADEHFSGFLDDYSQLKKESGKYLDYMYMDSDIQKKLAGTTALVIPQPEIHIAKDSKYTGAQPDDLKLLSDTFYSLLVNELSGSYQIGQNPMAGAAVVRIGITNVYLKKHHRGLLGFTPIGLVAGAAKNAGVSKFQKHVDLTGATIEAEIILGGSNERLAAMVDNMGSRNTKKEFANWNDFETEMQTLAKRLKCRLDNAHNGGSQDCDAIM